MNTKENLFALPGEYIIREGKAPELLPDLTPLVIDISGTIKTVTEFLTKRADQPDQINQKRCLIIVNRDNITIVLTICENDSRTKRTISAQLELHPKFEEFGINVKKFWEPNALGQFFKMNRAFFPDRANNMSLVTELKNFYANVNSKIEKQKFESGDWKDNFSGTVTSNLPGVFSLNIPIFKGVPAEIIEVEFYASVSGKDVSLQLVSPGASQLTEDIRDQVIDDELEKIKVLCPDIAIIEE